jgi:DNA-binding transcriptional MerR regulator
MTHGTEAVAPPLYSVAETAALSGLTAHTLRYYEREGLLAPPARGTNGHRKYTRQDLDWLRVLTRLRATGMPIALLRQYVHLSRSGEDSVAPRRALLIEHRERVLRQLEQVGADLALIETKIRRINAAGRLDCSESTETTSTTEERA